MSLKVHADIFDQIEFSKFGSLVVEAEEDKLLGNHFDIYRCEWDFSKSTPSIRPYSCIYLQKAPINKKTDLVAAPYLIVYDGPFSNKDVFTNFTFINIFKRQTKVVLLKKVTLSLQYGNFSQLQLEHDYDSPLTQKKLDFLYSSLFNNNTNIHEFCKNHDRIAKKSKDWIDKLCRQSLSWEPFKAPSLYTFSKMDSTIIVNKPTIRKKRPFSWVHRKYVVKQIQSPLVPTKGLRLEAPSAEIDLFLFPGNYHFNIQLVDSSQKEDTLSGSLSIQSSNE